MHQTAETSGDGKNNGISGQKLIDQGIKIF